MDDTIGHILQLKIFIIQSRTRSTGNEGAKTRDIISNYRLKA